MKINVKSDRTKKISYRTVKIEVDKFIVTEVYENDKLMSQKWSVYGGFKTTHPDAYEPQHLSFMYYEDISFLDCDHELSPEDIPDPTFITDWSTFDSLDNILCVHLPMDGNIYQINKPQPLPIWRYFNYIGGIDNKKFDLKKVVTQLNRYSFVRNVRQIEIPYYNQEEDKTEAVEFQYKLPSQKDLGKRLKKCKLFKDHYFLFE